MTLDYEIVLSIHFGKESVLFVVKDWAFMMKVLNNLNKLDSGMIRVQRAMICSIN